MTGHRRAVVLPGSTTVRGSTTPRLWTPPLVIGPPGPCGCGCALTEETSYGYDVIRFAVDQLAHPPDPWQRWLFIHAGELLPDGRPRFRIVLVLVSRQNGKTECLVILSLYWQFVAGVPLTLGTSTKLDYAKESWRKAVKLAERAPDLAALRPKRWKREANGEQESWTVDEARYKIAASNEEGGRSLTIDRLIADELRQHHDYSAWDAAEPATGAVWDAQIWALSNAGDDRSVVLNDLRAAALDHIDNGDGDPRMMLAEWSAPADADVEDVAALAQANPNLGRRIDPDALLAIARRAKRAGGKALTGFKTERMCIRVRLLNPAITPERWRGCLDPGSLADLRSRVALCIDLAPDGLHATLYAAAMLDDGRVRVDHVADWAGPDAAAQLARDLPDHVARVRPRVLGWLPNGPAAAVAATVADRNKAGAGRRPWPPPGVKVEEIRGEVAAVCMGFAALVNARQLAHAGDPLLDAQVAAAEKLKRAGDTWVFSRQPPAGENEDGDDGDQGDDAAGHVDAVYAAAGAAHLARTMPPPVGRQRVIVVGD